MPRFQVSCSVSAQGYLEIEASNADEARKAVEHVTPSIDFTGGSRFEIDYSLFDQCADLQVDYVTEVEEESE